MPVLDIACALPKGTYLPKGEYTQADQSPLIIENPAGHSDEGQSFASIEVKADDDLSGEQSAAFRFDAANRLLRRVNRLLRWHRAVTQWATIREMTLAQASPFAFMLAGTDVVWGTFNASPFPISSFSGGSTKDTAELVREGFASGGEPAVEVLLLLDARQALSEGRFRESVLASWSVIDGTFNRNFDSLVKKSLAGEWPDAIKFLTGNDFGLRNKMTIGLRLVANRSFHREPDELWRRLSESYKVRNAIIHEGSLASESEAKSAVWVAERIVELMSTL